MNAPLLKEFIYDATTAEVWSALTTKNLMQRWYFPQLRNFEPVVGSKFEFSDDDAEYQKEWIVTEVEDKQAFAHSWAYKGFPGSSEVRFELAPMGNQTKLRVTQVGLDSFPPAPHFKRERFEAGWENLLGHNLRNLLQRI